MNKNTTELQKIKEIEGPFPGMSKTSKYLFLYYKYQNSDLISLQLPYSES